jgi:hypothetical protein
MTQIRESDVQRSKNGKAATITIRHSKCDQLRQGQSAKIVANTEDSSTCPIRALDRYAKITRGAGEDFLLRTHRKEGIQTKGVSYNLTRTIVRDAVKELGLNADEYGTHSLRAGGVTAAAKEDVDWHLIQLQGRWAQTASMMRYEEFSDEMRERAPAAALGLHKTQAEQQKPNRPKKPQPRAKPKKQNVAKEEAHSRKLRSSNSKTHAKP